MEVTKQLAQYYGKIFETELILEIAKEGHIKQVEKGETLIKPGEYIKYMPLLLEGIIKIFRVEDSGHELLLYFLEKGDTCAMTLNCCTRNNLSEIRAEAYTDASFVLIPVDKMKEWLKFESWREFVFESMNIRFNELLDTIDSLAFHNLEERLVKYLNNKYLMSKGGNISLTHQNIAQDLSTSRVVISRLLKKLEKTGKIELHRNTIHINRL